MTRPVDAGGSPTPPPVRSEATGGSPPPWDPAADAPTGPVAIPPAASAAPVGTAAPDVPRIGVGRPDRPAMGWTEIGVATAVYVALQALLGGAALTLVRATGSAVPTAPVLVAVSALAAFGAVGVASVLRVRSFAALGLRRVPGRVLASTVGIGLGVWVMSRLLSALWILVSGETGDPQAELRFTGVTSTLLMLVLAGIVVPCGEELLFRGVLFGAIRPYGLAVATATSALVFGLAHGFNAVLPAAALLGVANCLLYERTRSVVPAMIVHTMFNLLSLVLVLIVA